MLFFYTNIIYYENKQTQDLICQGLERGVTGTICFGGISGLSLHSLHSFPITDLELRKGARLLG